MLRANETLSRRRRRAPWSNLFYSFSALLMLFTFLVSCEAPWSATASPTPTPAPYPVNCQHHSSDPVTLTLYYGSEKEAWMSDVIADFNNHHYAGCDGLITVNAIPIGSGDSLQQILNGSIRPDVWSPAGSVWLSLLNARWQQKSGQTLIDMGASATPSLVSSPVVIAMWKPLAQALGWPQRAIGWSDIARLSSNPQGWAAYGHPEAGSFKFGHTHPAYSNSGLDAIIAMSYAALGKQRGLTVADISDPRVRSLIGDIEEAVIHYGDSTGFFADEMFNKGPSFLSAAVMYENLVVEANDGHSYPHLPLPVVAIYPKEGTFYSDHPYAILHGSWLTPAKESAAEILRAFLLAPQQQAKALRYGFRPAVASVAIGAPIDSAHGVDPKQPRTILQVPSVDVVNAIESTWQAQKRRVAAMLILDTSGSMNDDFNGMSKIDAARQGLSDFVRLMSDDDLLGLTIFSDQARVISPLSLVGSKRQQVLQQIATIAADGSTRLFDTIAEQVQTLNSFATDDIKAIVVLTDGQDNVSQLSRDELLRRITPEGEDAGRGIKVFTIAYGDDADVEALKSIAAATGAQEYAGTPQNIRAVYNQISLFF
ncbi:substrate-binding and vWA domain-containing protein [Thermogemmatispora carboxidivorans]|uniref:substrate-binding and vWA domain-containing protein n=1 Tax=Thermogemmatispora carboxidivorans TaxID=1382306 RepID=UPI00069C57D3|nr:substrate-binding and VWA domain-containing protein [Thermogemmatispora carboxidivorans]